MGSDISLSKAVRANLLSLQNTAQMMDKTQSRLATGNKVNSALDNPSSFFTASALNSRAADMGNLLDAMASGVKVIEAANNGLTAITKNLESMQSTLRQARQDKSFQSQTFDVSAESTITVNGGRFDTGATIKLQTQAPAIKADVQSKAPYSGAVPSAKEGFGARAVITLDGNAAAVAGDRMKIDGVEIQLTDGTVTDFHDKLRAALGFSADAAGSAELAKQYTITAGNGTNGAAAGEVIIEAASPYANAPKIEFGAGVVEATKGATTFKFDPTAVGSVTVGSQTIENTGSFDSFVAGLMSKAEAGKYTVTADAATKQITLTNTEYGNTAPEVSGVPTYTNNAVTTFNIGGAANGVSGAANGDKFTLDGVELTLDLSAAGATPTQDQTAAAIKAAIEGNAELNSRYAVQTTASAAGVDAKVEIKAKAVGANPAPALTVGDLALKGIKNQAGQTGALSTNGSTTGAKVQTVEAAADKIEVSYGTKSAKIDLHAMVVKDPAQISFTSGATDAAFTFKLDGETFSVGAGTSRSAADTASAIKAAIATKPEIASKYDISGTNPAVTIKSKGGAAAAKLEIVNTISGTITTTNGPTVAEIDTYRAAATKDINDQLKAQGLAEVEASFDSTGRLSITAKNGEEKMLNISGDQASQLFSGDTKSVGKAEVSGYNGKTTVDKFVEEINRSHDGKLRASNDNGKLRIENLSTEKLNLSVDADGEGLGAPTQHSIDGNSVRASLAKQYNELRDQMDKLASDSSFNGINLLRGDKLTITFNESGTSSIGIQAKDKDGNVRGINAANLGVSDIVAEELDTDEAIDAFLSKISGALSELRSQASTFGSNLSSVENRQSFTKNMINTLETGAANLTLADTNAEAANLLALQTRQQLSSSALSMASQQDQAVLQLLR
jgi:flagellin-like hook-associated protein FlgL